MQFTPQQLQGGPRFAHKTRIGNWQEDWESADTKLKEYMKKKETGKLVINATQQKYAKSLQKVPQTYSEDGFLRFGDSIQLFNQQTNGFLVFDLSDRITSHDEAYATTTTAKDNGPCARGVLVLTKGENDGSTDNVIKYGQKVKFESTPYIYNKKLYLHSQPVSPQFYARFSRNQEVCMAAKNIYNCVWKIVHPDPNMRGPSLGHPVEANLPVLIEHCATSHFLASDNIQYRNDFGTEYEVCVHSYASNNKSQALSLEKTGKITRDEPTKHQSKQNYWVICTASDPSLATPIAEPPKYNAQDLINDIKNTLKKRSANGIRGLARVFKMLDNNRNRSLDVQELQQGLGDFGIHLDNEQAQAILASLDRDRNGQVSFDEFLRALRGDLNESRISWIKRAYQKLDANKDGQVKLDDIALLYDVSSHPDVGQGRKQPMEVYKEFMSQWDTQVADGIVTIEEFMDYFRDVSASIDSDEYFAQMMKSAWKL